MPLPFHFAAAVTPLHLAFVLFAVFGALLATARCWKHCFWWRWIGGAGR